MGGKQDTKYSFSTTYRRRNKVVEEGAGGLGDEREARPDEGK
jgi:hypothetical protein